MKDINTDRFIPFLCKKGDGKEGGCRGQNGRKGERFLSLSLSPSLSSVHVGKGVCNAVESSGAKSQMELPTCRGVGETTGEGLEREERRRGIAEGGTIGSSVALCTQAQSRISYPFRRFSRRERDSPALSSAQETEGNEKEVVEERG